MENIGDFRANSNEVSKFVVLFSLVVIDLRRAKRNNVILTLLFTMKVNMKCTPNFFMVTTNFRNGDLHGVYGTPSSKKQWEHCTGTIIHVQKSADIRSGYDHEHMIARTT